MFNPYYIYSVDGMQAYRLGPIDQHWYTCQGRKRDLCYLFAKPPCLRMEKDAAAMPTNLEIVRYAFDVAQGRNSLLGLPSELLEMILSKLDVYSLFRISFASERLWALGMHVLDRKIRRSLRSWRNSRIICFGNSCEREDILMDVLTAKEGELLWEDHPENHSADYGEEDLYPSDTDSDYDPSLYGDRPDIEDDAEVGLSRMDALSELQDDMHDYENDPSYACFEWDLEHSESDTEEDLYPSETDSDYDPSLDGDRPDIEDDAEDSRLSRMDALSELQDDMHDYENDPSYACFEWNLEDPESDSEDDDANVEINSNKEENSKVSSGEAVQSARPRVQPIAMHDPSLHLPMAFHLSECNHLTVSQWQYLWDFVHRPISYYFKSDEIWVLRNLTTKEFVRGEGLFSAFQGPGHRCGPDIGFPGFFEAILCRVSLRTDKDCFGRSASPHPSWYGHRFEICCQTDHLTDSKTAWNDVTAEIVAELRLVLQDTHEVLIGNRNGFYHRHSE